MVIVVIGLLAALLLPAIGGAVRTARSAAVTAEINLMAQALENFRVNYGDYPPSRILLSEAGTYTVDSTTNSYAKGIVDMTDGMLATRSVTWLRKFWPRMNLGVGTTSNPPSSPSIAGPLGYYDFNNNQTADPPYVLTGDECLVFFLGGIPSQVTSGSGKTIFGLNGFNRDATNPTLAPAFKVGSTAYTYSARTAPLLEFNSGRLADPDKDGMPSYNDSIGNNNKFYAYFSAYGGGGYDPSDVDDPTEDDGSGTAPIALKFTVGFPVGSGGGRVATSAAPNPYTATATVLASGSVIWQRPQSYQVVSCGYDGMYGVGGQYVSGGSPALPVDTTNTTPSGSGQSIRVRESDNLTSFATGKLD